MGNKNLKFKVIVNGNCMMCGKPLSGERIFLCETCEKPEKEYREGKQKEGGHHGKEEERPASVR